MGLEGKVAVVSGASSGIGAAMCKLLEKKGARVAGLDISEPPSGGVGSSDNSVFVRCDVTKPDSWASAIAQVNEHLGDISALFLNAGVMLRPPNVSTATDALELADSDAYHRVFNVNVHGLVNGLKAARESMVRAGDAGVVATSSVAGIGGLSFDPYYSMTKYAVVGFVRSFAPVLEPLGVRIHAICPGGVQTAIVPDDAKHLIDNFMTPETLAENAIALLGLDTTGEIWVKDETDKPRWKVQSAYGTDEGLD